jgi:hypothetical protein
VATAFSFTIQALARHHDLGPFDCGDPGRNNWLRARGLANKASDYSQTYVAVTPDTRVVGFYSLSSSSVTRQALPRSDRHGAPGPVPMVLLGQLGVDRLAQGQLLGEQLVVDAFERVVMAADIIGCRLLGVHPAHDWLVPYYQRLGFSLGLNATPALMVVTVPRLRHFLAGP